MEALQPKHNVAGIESGLAWVELLLDFEEGVKLPTRAVVKANCRVGIAGQYKLFV